MPTKKKGASKDAKKSKRKAGTEIDVDDLAKVAGGVCSHAPDKILRQGTIPPIRLPTRGGTTRGGG